jgi:hypothetical protein
MKRNLFTWFAVMSFAASLQGQSFTNLDFESARVIFSPNPQVATSNAFPNWSVFDGTNQVSYVLYNYIKGVNFAGLVGSNSLVLNGNFGDAMGPNETISQTGLVPNGAESLLFDATSSLFLVSLGDQSLSFMAISNALNSYGNSYTVYGADISGFAGQVETLTFSAPSGYYGILDDIRFSPEAIPEPSALSLICLGSGILFYVRKRRRFHCGVSFHRSRSVR